LLAAPCHLRHFCLFFTLPQLQTPPSGVTLDHLTVVSLEKALSGNSVWAPCQQYFGIFEQVEQETGVPAILLAAFALQESTCQHDVSARSTRRISALRSLFSAVKQVAGDNGGAFGYENMLKLVLHNSRLTVALSFSFAASCKSPRTSAQVATRPVAKNPTSTSRLLLL
jgi:hypothetical protein